MLWPNRCLGRIEFDSKDYKRASGRRATVQLVRASQNKIVLRWNEAQLNCASLRSSLHYGVGGVVKGQEERQNPAPLTAPPNRGKAVRYFLIDLADDFIDVGNGDYHSIS